MSVFEFFIQYWDWYLLIGYIVATAMFVNTDKPDRFAEWMQFAALVFFILIGWPIFVTAVWLNGVGR